VSSSDDFFVLDDVVVNVQGLVDARVWVGFDEVVGSCGSEPAVGPVIRGLSWQNFYIENRCVASPLVSSTPNVAFNGYAATATIGVPSGYTGTFGIASMRLGSRVLPSLAVTVTGFRGAVQVGSVVVTAVATGLQTVTLPAGFGSVDRVTMSTPGGAGAFFVVDDILVDVRGLVLIGVDGIGFDDLPPLPAGVCTSVTPVPTSYRGLKWENAYYLGQCPNHAAPTSGVNTAFNGVCGAWCTLLLMLVVGCLSSRVCVYVCSVLDCVALLVTMGPAIVWV
jgi:hypothetical protein